MKKYILFFTLVFALVATPVREAEAANPWAAVIKAAIKKVVKAVDLMIQRRQNKVIRLQNAQKAIENTMAKLQLDEITDWVKKQRDLYKKYYDELKKVKAVIAYYFKIKQIADKNSRLVDEYKRFWGLISDDKHFTAQERNYIFQVYVGILENSAKNVDLLKMVVESLTMQMTDAKRLELIENAADKTDQLYTDLTRFNQENAMLSISRAKNQHEVDVVKKLYGLN